MKKKPREFIIPFESTRVLTAEQGPIDRHLQAKFEKSSRRNAARVSRGFRLQLSPDGC